jgi:hypothetical protein
MPVCPDPWQSGASRSLIHREQVDSQFGRNFGKISRRTLETG